MNYIKLSLDQAPDIWTPLRFFMTAPLFAIAAVILALYTGPEILQNRWLPQTLAVTHLLSLGFVTLVMMGAMFQLLPVLAGSAIYKSAKSSQIIYVLMLIGVSFFCMGFMLTKSYLLKIGVIILIPGILLFLVLVSIALYKAKSTFASANGMRISISSLWIVLALGGVLAIGWAWESIPLLRSFTQIHIIWAALGWVTVMVAAMAYQVIPMFQITAEYPDRFKRFFLVFLFICLIALSIQMWAGYNTSFLMLLISLILVSFSVISIKLLWKRKKRLMDASVYYWFTGLVALVVCVLMFNVNVYLNINIDMLIGFIFFFGFAMSIINGMLFKIVPFLVWLHLNKKLVFSSQGLSAVPTMNEVINRKKMMRQYMWYIFALLLTLLSFFNPEVFFYPALSVLIISLSLLFIYLFQAMNVYYHCCANISSSYN